MADSSSAKRSSVSCTECQRRKQRCSRTWPCDRCLSRRISHECHFKTKASEQIGSSLCARASDPLTRLRPDPFSPVSRLDHDENPITTNEAITAWGYMPEREHFNLISVGIAVPHAALVSSPSTSRDRLKEHTATAIAVLPCRAVTDILIQNFVHSVNYFHYAVYPPQFLTDYNDWWYKRANHLNPSPAFTCLLIRICACSAQYLDGALRLQIECDLGEGVNILANRYHDAARDLSRRIDPGEGGLTQVQQLFLSVTWCKGESKFVDAWHSLGAAIREAQEIGLHKDSFAGDCSEFDLEMRRRLWCVLYLWDWYLSRWLSRPLLIDQKSCSVTPPCLNLEHSGQFSGPPSPFTPVLLQYQLALQLSDDSNRQIHDPTIAATVLQQIEAWVESFPAVYRSSDPDTSWDDEHLYLPFQRKHLHLMSNLFKLSPVKHFLTKDPREGFTKLESELRTAGVEVSIRIIKIARELFEQMSSPAARGFIVVCVAFITTTLLISAIMRDTEQTLPHRELILESVHSTLDMTHQLRDVTAAGRVAYNILSGLVRSLPLYPDEVALVKFGTCTAALQQQASTEEEQSNHFLLLGKNQIRLQQTSNQIATTGSGIMAGKVDHPLSGTKGDCVLLRPAREQEEEDNDGVVVPSEEDFMNADWSALAEIWGSLDPVFVQ